MHFVFCVTDIFKYTLVFNHWNIVFLVRSSLHLHAWQHKNNSLSFTRFFFPKSQSPHPGTHPWPVEQPLQSFQLLYFFFLKPFQLIFISSKWHVLQKSTCLTIFFLKKWIVSYSLFEYRQTKKSSEFNWAALSPFCA